MCDPYRFPTDWHSFPNLHLRNRNRLFPEYSSACPYEGGTDRIWILPNGKPDGDGRGFIWCRACGMSLQIGCSQKPAGRRQLVQPTPRLLNPAIALRYHDQLGVHRRYFHARGISDEMIDRHKLGWKTEWQRYSIPCWLLSDDGELELWGIQLRASWRNPERKYVSEPGSRNKQLFNARVCAGQLQPYILIIESPLDCLTLWSRWRIPAVAPFQGNNPFRAWEPAWNRWLLVKDRIIVPDNDANGAGDLIARSKQASIPGSRIHYLPKGVKDIGEYILAGGDVPRWLGLPPTGEDVKATQTTHSK